MQQYNNVTLSVNITNLTGIIFLMTVFRHIRFGSASKLDNMEYGHIFKYFKALIGAYITRGFKVTIVLANTQFEPMRDNLSNLHTQIHITS